MASELPVPNPVETVTQPMLDGMPPDPQPRFDPNRRRAFGSVPGLLGVEIDYSGMNPERDNPHIDRQYLAASLYGMKGQYVVSGLALNEQEYAGILINAPTFSRRISARAATAHTASAPTRQTEVSLTAPLHALEKQVDVQASFVSALSTEHEKIQKLLKYARQPGHAHIKEIDMRMLATEVFVGSFSNLLRVVGTQREWTEEERVGAEQALSQQLFTGSQRSRIGNWQTMLGITEQYTARKKTLFTQRLHVAESGVADLTKKLLKFYAAHELE